jgi:UPF0755 protein
MANKKSRGLTIIIVILAIIVVCVVGFLGNNYISSDINGGDDDGSSPVTLTIYDSDSQYDVSLDLYKSGVVISDSLWSNWMDKHYPNFEYVAGEYEVYSYMSYDEIATALQNPLVTHRGVSVCIPEGYDVFKISTTLEENGVCSAEDFLNACMSTSDYDYSFLANIPDSNTIAYKLEGFLFPATYDFMENMDATDVVDQMLSAFADRIQPEWTEYCEQNNITLYELVTLSSIVEKETLGEGVANRIASVFINRLNANQQLQSDVTIDYGNKLREAGFDDDIVVSYNTYKCSALPSGPICNPGVENIDAVVNHEDTDYFYFFSYNNGSDFYFTDSYDDFQTQWANLGSTNTN